MKTLIVSLFVACALVKSMAGIVITNVVPLASYTVGTNTGSSFIAPQSHYASPLSVSIYHSETNYLFLTTNILQVSFDGGQTWANVQQFVNSTNTTSDVWTMPQATLNPTNRILVITKTNQTIYMNASWQN